MTSTTTKPSLPAVVAERHRKGTRKPPAFHPYSFLEAIKVTTGFEEDLIWGPFYKRFRAVRKESANWKGFSLGSIWDGIPAASQTKPGVIARFYHNLTGGDPAPSLTPQPKSKQSTNSTSMPTTMNYDDWQEVTKFKDDWSPSQIDFIQWYGRYRHPADYDNDFYEDNYKALYDKVCDFAESWFGQGVHLEDSRDDTPEISTWEVPMTEQFIQYARVVAHEDKGYVEWQDILSDPKHRKWLCVAVLSQIFERKIFNQLLFGASKEYEKELDRHDNSWLAAEGFTRKEGRRQIARAALGGGLVPENFWDAVDDLAGQTVLIFKPLFMLMCMATRGTPHARGAVFFQEVHTLLAMAGYFQVCTAVSPSIFHILSATPGARFQWEEEEHADQEIYEHSKSFHKSHEDRWRVLAELSSKSDSSMVAKLTEPDDVDSTLYMPFPTTEAEYRMMDHQRRRGGKVMYSVFPKLTRYSAKNIGNIILDTRDKATSRDELMKSEGMEISVLCRGMVIYYQGLVHDKTVGADGELLDDHLLAIATDRMKFGVLPYFRYYWNENGSPRYWPHWPVWPEGTDKFWLSLLIYITTMRILEFYLGPFDKGDDNPLWQKYFFRSNSWIAFDVFTYVMIRLWGWSLLDGRYAFLKLQAIFAILLTLIELLLRYQDRNLKFFSYFALPFLWLDKWCFYKFPIFLEAFGRAQADGNVRGFGVRLAEGLRAVNVTAPGQ